MLGMIEKNNLIVQNENGRFTETDALPIDILGRDGIIEWIMNLLGILSETRSSCTFALNGRWGSGKTYIVKKLEQQLRDYQDVGKFVVFHYNCWQYNYYEEPLIAIVSAMQDSIDEQIHLFGPAIREQAGKILEASKNVIKKVAVSFVENKIGINVDEVVESVEKGLEEGQKKHEKRCEYDNYYAFKKTIDEARKQLSELSKDVTVVIVVDELDRCLPKYTIKILERLHHLFAGINNVIVIMTLDGEQLDRTIKNIFGKDTESQKYLKKFIDFELPVDVGTIQGGFLEKYSSLTTLFDSVILEPWTDIDKYFTALFAGIDIRTQEHLIKKVETIHKILFRDEKKDFSFLCFELLMAVFSNFPQTIDIAPLILKENRKTGCYEVNVANVFSPTFIKYIKENWNYMVTIHLGSKDTELSFSGVLDIPRLLICYSEDVYSNKNMCELCSDFPSWNIGCVHEFQEFKRLLQIIK